MTDGPMPPRPTPDQLRDPLVQLQLHLADAPDTLARLARFVRWQQESRRQDTFE